MAQKGGYIFHLCIYTRNNKGPSTNPCGRAKHQPCGCQLVWRQAADPSMDWWFSSGDEMLCAVLDFFLH